MKRTSKVGAEWPPHKIEEVPPPTLPADKQLRLEGKLVQSDCKKLDADLPSLSFANPDFGKF